MSKKVSIIVPIYNVEKYLEQCLESLKKQTYLNLEILMVDDGSTDSSGRICDEFAKKDKRFVVLHKSNGGVSSARKTGMKNASGAYIMFVDGDDWLDLDTVRKCVSAIEQDNRIGCVLFSYAKEVEGATIPMHVMDESLKLYDKEVEIKIYRRLFGLSKDELSHPERMENIVSCCMKLYRVEYARRGKYFDTKWIGSCEDGLFNIYALQRCKGVVYIDETLYHYRKGTGTLTSTYRPALVKQWSNLFDEMLKAIKRYELGDDYLEALDNRIALSITAIGLNELKNPNHGSIGHIEEIHQYLSRERYQKACKNLEWRQLPVVWQFLMLASKYKISFLVYIIIKMISVIRKR